MTVAPARCGSACSTAPLGEDLRCTLTADHTAPKHAVIVDGRLLAQWPVRTNSTNRVVAQSLFPSIQPDRPVGRILASVFTGTNADLMAAVAPFYINGSVMDATYGEGNWWLRGEPETFVGHDLKTDGVDFTALPEPDATYDTVCFDPPYIPQGGVKHRTQSDFKDRFGLVSRSEAQLWELIDAGFTECARVLRPGGHLLMKCTDYVNGAAITFGHIKAIGIAEAIGLRCHDLIVHAGHPGPGGHNIFIPKRARRSHSYLLVFVKRRPARTAA